MQAHLNKLRFLIFGILSGIPFYVTLSALSFYLSEHHFNPLEIGKFAIITIPYSLKFIWSPFLDTIITKKSYTRFQIFKFLGFLFSLVTGFCHIGIGIIEPLNSFFWMSILGLCTSFFASLQDLLIDALRLEFFHKKQQTKYIVIQTVGFRIGLLLGSAGIIYTAAYFGWSYAFTLFGLFHIALSFIFLSFNFNNIESIDHIKEAILTKSIQQKIAEFTELSLNKSFLYIVCFVLFFKMGDICVQSMTTPLLFEHGYTKIAFANLTKTYGIPMMILGTFLLPWILKKFSFAKLIYIVLLLQALSTFSFLFFIAFENSKTVHLIIIGITSLISGLTSATFITITSELSLHPFKTTQFNIFSTASALGRVLISTFSGFIAFYFGWSSLFILMTLIVFIFSIITLYNHKRIFSSLYKGAHTPNNTKELHVAPNR